MVENDNGLLIENEKTNDFPYYCNHGHTSIRDNSWKKTFPGCSVNNGSTYDVDRPGTICLPDSRETNNNMESDEIKGTIEELEANAVRELFGMDNITDENLERIDLQKLKDINEKVKNLDKRKVDSPKNYFQARDATLKRLERLCEIIDQRTRPYFLNNSPWPCTIKQSEISAYINVLIEYGYVAIDKQGIYSIINEPFKPDDFTEDGKDSIYEDILILS